jgi:hypothetical protein
LGPAPPAAGFGGAGCCRNQAGEPFAAGPVNSCATAQLVLAAIKAAAMPRHFIMYPPVIISRPPLSITASPRGC